MSATTFRIAPSILSANFAKLGEEVDNVLAAGADIVHFDVMDNHYVPNLTIGPLVCEALRKHGVTAPIDVHLMVKPVDRIIPDFAKAGATYITFHPEASEHVDRTIGLIRECGCKPGLVFNPGHAAGRARIHAGQARHGAADVGQPGLRRPEVHPLRARQGAQGAPDDRCPRPERRASKSTAASARPTSSKWPRPASIPSSPARPCSAPARTATRNRYDTVIAALRAELAKA